MPGTAVARHPARFSCTAALLAAGLLATPAQAQQIVVDLESSEGTISVQLYGDVNLAPFVNAFATHYSGPPGGFVFHRSDKDPCDLGSCACISFDCTGCQDLLEPLFRCDDEEPAVCSCSDPMTTPAFECTLNEGTTMQCPVSAVANPNLATCTCADDSEPAFACEDESAPPIGVVESPVFKEPPFFGPGILARGNWPLDSPAFVDPLVAFDAGKITGLAVG